MEQSLARHDRELQTLLRQQPAWSILLSQTALLLCLILLRLHLPDFDKQLAINLFLGIDKELKASAKCLVKRSYQDWFDPRHLEPVMNLEEAERRLRLTISQAADYVTEYYRPRLYTTLDRHFAFKINSTSKYLALVWKSACLMKLFLRPDVSPST